MKIISFMALLFGIHATASYTNCPIQVSQKPHYNRAWKFLKALKPRFEIDNCQVEIHICEVSEEPGSDDIVGDMWVRNQKGVEQYVTFFFPTGKGEKIDAGKNWFRYRHKDSHFDEVHGNKEKVSLAIDLRDDAITMTRIDLATYSSTENDRFLGIVPMSIWSVCRK